MPSWLDRLKSREKGTAWLLERSCAPIKYRTLIEVLGRAEGEPEVAAAREGINTYEPTIKIARSQKENGTWLDKILEFEPPNNSRHRGPGMVNQFLALLELGWDKTHPIVHCSAHLLFSYLKKDPKKDLFELKGYAGANALANVAIRDALSVLAAGLLSRAGYADDPDVTEVADRVLAELAKQYPANGKPDLYDGTIEIKEETKDDGIYRRIRPGHHVPEMFLYYLLAFHPRFQSDAAARAVVSRVTAHLMEGDPIALRIREAEGKRFLKLVDLHVGNWGTAEFGLGRVGFVLHDLELLARTGTLVENAKAMELLEWLLAGEDAEGIFRPDDARIDKVVSRSQYHYFPLEDSWRGKHKKFTDFTFRMHLILKCLDRTTPIEG